VGESVLYSPSNPTLGVLRVDYLGGGHRDSGGWLFLEVPHKGNLFGIEETEGAPITSSPHSEQGISHSSMFHSRAYSPGASFLDVFFEEKESFFSKRGGFLGQENEINRGLLMRRVSQRGSLRGVVTRTNREGKRLRGNFSSHAWCSFSRGRWKRESPLRSYLEFTSSGRSRKAKNSTTLLRSNDWEREISSLRRLSYIPPRRLLTILLRPRRESYEEGIARTPPLRSNHLIKRTPIWPRK